jgi:predicted amino acid dehydrogenase
MLESITQQTRNRWYGPDALASWQRDRQQRGCSTKLDVVLLTHPRDERDMSMLYPFTDDLSFPDIRRFAHALEPVCGEVIETPDLAVGLMFMFRFADEMLDPRNRGDIRTLLMGSALDAVAATGARVVCLGGLLGALSGYGKRLASYAQANALTVTTGHSMTSVTVLQTYRRAIVELGLNPASSRVVILGVGSVGAAFGRLLAREELPPAEMVIVDKPERARHVEELASELTATGLATRIDLTDRDGQLRSNSLCYDTQFLISAVSTPNVIDIERVAPCTVLVDDSQPNCWSRERAWRRVNRFADIAPCEAGLVEAASISYWSYFPFRFASQDAAGGTSVAWCCLAEGLAMGHDSTLPPTVGEPEIAGLAQYQGAFERLGFSVAPLQCGSHFLPIEALRDGFAGRHARWQPVAPVVAQRSREQIGREKRVAREAIPS